MVSLLFNLGKNTGLFLNCITGGSKLTRSTTFPKFLYLLLTLGIYVFSFYLRLKFVLGIISAIYNYYYCKYNFFGVGFFVWDFDCFICGLIGLHYSSYFLSMITTDCFYGFLLTTTIVEILLLPSLIAFSSS